MAELKSAQGWAETYTYDGFNLAGIQHKQGAAPFANYAYTYDNNRNIVAKNDNGAAFQFSYDPLNRIKTSSQFNEAYAYDQRDNRSTLQSDQVPNIKGASYAYDSRNRLTQVTTEDGKAVSYRYNGDNLMVERTEGGVTTRYYYDDRAKIVAEGRVEGNCSVTITTAYVHDSTGKLLARQVPGQGMQYYVSNGHGDITEIRDAQGNVLNRYTYDIWGNPLVQEEQVPNIFRYSGEYWDTTTNLQYLRARWYDPSIGRLINEDTYEGDINDPLSLNLYTYVKNNPLKYLDPTGHIEFSVGDKEALLRYQSVFSVGQKEKNLLIMQSAHDAANYLRLNYESRVDRINFFKDGIVYKSLTKDMYNELLFGNAKEVPLLDDPLFYVFDGTFALAYKGVAKLAAKTMGKKSVDQTTEYLLKLDLQMFEAKKDLKMVNDAAKKVGVDRNKFGEYIHQLKKEFNMKANDNFSWDDLLEFANELKSMTKK